MTMQETFADVVNRLREEMGLSIRELAEAAKINRRTLEDYIAGGRGKSPSLEMGFKLAKALGVDVNVFADCKFGGPRGGAKKKRKKTSRAQ
jgi:transcriptional regulator with XRE-family HTH domain